jgi:hypothetical protein
MAIVQLEGLDQLKNPMGFKPATFRLVAQCLSQLHYRVHPICHFSNLARHLLFGKGSRSRGHLTVLLDKIRMRKRWSLCGCCEVASGQNYTTATSLSNIHTVE